jgi:hypothetical protein
VDVFISKALAAKKARGTQLGTPSNLTEAAREQSLLVRRAHLQQHLGLPAANSSLYCLPLGAGGKLSPTGGGVEFSRLYGATWGAFNQKQVQRLHE